MSSHWVVTYKDNEGAFDVIFYHKDIYITKEDALEKFQTVSKDTKWTILTVGESYKEPISEIEGHMILHLLAGLDNMLGSEKLLGILSDEGWADVAKNFRKIMVKVKEDYGLGK